MDRKKVQTILNVSMVNAEDCKMHLRRSNIYLTRQ